MSTTIIAWGLIGLLGCAAFAALGLWATYTSAPEPVRRPRPEQFVPWEGPLPEPDPVGR